MKLPILYASFVGIVEGLSFARMVPILYDSSNHLHRDSTYHPECPARIDCIVTSISAQMEDLPFPIDLIDVAPLTAKPSELALSLSSVSKNQSFKEESLSNARKCLAAVHSEEMVESIETQCRESRNRRVEEGKDPLGFMGYLDSDTYLTTESYNVFERACASWIDCIDRVLADYIDRERPGGAGIESDDIPSVAMALTRPPGHHALRSLPNGFCTFNFAAAAAFHAISSAATKDICQKVFILDWDVHYGQGVSDIIQNYPNVRYASIHQVPAFPYEGQERKIRGKHKNIQTLPLPPDSTWTCGYESYFTEELLPFCSSPEWKPDLVIVCAGYDALSSDELASCNLVAKDYGKMTRLLLDHLSLEGSCKGIVFGLEGGYQLNEDVQGGNLADAVIETLKAVDCSDND